MDSKEFFKLVYQMREKQRKASENKNDEFSAKAAMVAQALVDMEIDKVDRLYTQKGLTKFWKGKQ